MDAPGAAQGWYWDDVSANSIKYQMMTFSQTDGVVTVSKKAGQGIVTTSPVTIDPVNRLITIPNTEIIKVTAGDGFCLPISGLAPTCCTYL